MGLFPMNTNVTRQAQTDLIGVRNRLLSVVRADLGSPVVADVDRILDGQATSDSEITTVTTFLAQPDVPRTISVLPLGTTASVPAGDVDIVGTDIADEVIADVVTFEANAATGLSTTKAFKTITSVVFPIQDGAGATYDVGVSDGIQLPDKLSQNTVFAAYLANVRETTAPAVTYSATVLSQNTINLNSAHNGAAVLVDYLN